MCNFCLILKLLSLEVDVADLLVADQTAFLVSDRRKELSRCLDGKWSCHSVCFLLVAF